MEDGLFTKQGKKLLFVALFLVGVAFLIGGEDNPGMIAQMQDSPSAADEEGYAPVPATARRTSPRREARQAETDTDLDDWYSEAGPVQMAVPAPIDDSHLIDDTRPAVTTDPVASPVAPEGALPIPDVQPVG